MDSSTISNKTNSTEFEEIGNGELTERYYSLKKQYENLSSSYDLVKQELFDSKRNYQIALDVQGHITAELESQQIEHERKKSELNCRITTLQEQVTSLRLENTACSERHIVELKDLQNEINRLKDEQVSKIDRESPKSDSHELEEVKAAVAAALVDAANFKSALEEAKAEIGLWKMKTEELMTEVNELRANADLRREELKAAVEREAAVMVDLAEARAMLHQCNDIQDLNSHAAKGNSIFAEVEDKRQEMAKTLLQLKQTNSRLKRDLANKQSELEMLLHEKQTVWEQQTGLSAHHDKELLEAYELRITQLEKMCERQRRELAQWFGKLTDTTTPGWLPAVLHHLKTECSKLREEVMASGMAELVSANQIRELQRKVAQLTAKGVKHNSPVKETPSSGIHQIEMSVKQRDITPEGVKKKVSFN